MMVSAIESGELRYEELSQRKVSPEKSQSNGHVDYYHKTGEEFESPASDMNHTVVSSGQGTYDYSVPSAENQQNGSSVTILDSGVSTGYDTTTAPDNQVFVPETQPEHLNPDIPSPTTIPETQDIAEGLDHALDESNCEESTQSETQLTGSVDVIPDIADNAGDEIVPQQTAGIFSYNSQTSGTGERSTRISQDSGFCETPSTFGEISKDSDIASQESSQI